MALRCPLHHYVKSNAINIHTLFIKNIQQISSNSTLGNLLAPCSCSLLSASTPDRLNENEKTIHVIHRCKHKHTLARAHSQSHPHTSTHTHAWKKKLRLRTAQVPFTSQHYFRIDFNRTIFARRWENVCAYAILILFAVMLIFIGCEWKPFSTYIGRK